MGEEGETGMLGEKLGRSKAGLRWWEKGEGLWRGAVLYLSPLCMEGV